MSHHTDSRARRHQPPSRGRPPWIWLAAVAVVVLAAVVAVVATRDSSSSAAKDTSSSGALLRQTAPVQVTGTALPALGDGGADPAVGLAIPTVTGQSFDGSPVSITADGKAKLILFVAHWCPHCQREVPLLSSYLQANPLPAGVELVTVATSTDASLPNYPPSAWLAKNDWPSPVLADSQDYAAATAFGLPGFPYFVAVDGSGKVVARTSGEITTDQFAQLAQAAAGSAASTT